MISRKLTAIWAVLLVALVAAGVVSLVLGILWKAPDLVRNLIISSSDTTAGIVLGATFLATAVFAVVAILQPNANTMLLHMLNWLLLACGLEAVSVGSFIWFYTLTETADFDALWLAQSPDNVVALQDIFQCCGYMNGTDHAVYQGFCADQATAASNAGCWLTVIGDADVTLNNIFTTIYGFMFIIILFFLATACVINKRVELERFNRIDEKRGGKGFV